MSSFAKFHFFFGENKWNNENEAEGNSSFRCISIGSDQCLYRIWQLHMIGMQRSANVQLKRKIEHPAEMVPTIVFTVSLNYLLRQLISWITLIIGHSAERWWTFGQIKTRTMPPHSMVSNSVKSALYGNSWKRKRMTDEQTKERRRRKKDSKEKGKTENVDSFL